MVMLSSEVTKMTPHIDGMIHELDRIDSLHDVRFIPNPICRIWDPARAAGM